MEIIDHLVTGNEAYAALQTSVLEADEMQKLTQVINYAAPLYRRVGNEVCTVLADMLGSDAYTSADYYTATYSAIAEAERGQTAIELSRRALLHLARQPDPAEPETAVEPEPLVQAAPLKPTSQTDTESGLTAEADTAEPTLEELVIADYALCQQVLAGDSEAQRRFVERYRRLIYKHVNALVRRLSAGSTEADDLFQEGMVYAMQRARVYNPGYKMRFGNFLKSFLPHHLERCSGQRYVVSIPDDIRAAIAAIQAINQARVGSGRGLMSDQRIANEFKLAPGAANTSHRRTVGDLRQAMMLTRYMGSIDTGFNPARDDSPGNEYVVDERQALEPVCGEVPPAPDEVAATVGLAEEIQAVLETLSEREVGIIRLTFGFGCTPQKPDQIGSVYGISRERVRQIYRQTLNKLRHPDRAKKLRPYIGDA